MKRERGENFAHSLQSKAVNLYHPLHTELLPWSEYMKYSSTFYVRGGAFSKWNSVHMIQALEKSSLTKSRVSSDAKRWPKQVADI